MAQKKETAHSAETIALYDKLIAAIPGLERKGAAFPYTSHNGHMFSMLDATGDFVLRLPDDSIEAFIKKYKTTHHVAYGIIRKEYAIVPASLFKKTKELMPYFQLSYDHVSSLKPKATAKTKK